MKAECLGSLMGDPLSLSLKAAGYEELILLPSEVQCLLLQTMSLNVAGSERD